MVAVADRPECSIPVVKSTPWRVAAQRYSGLLLGWFMLVFSVTFVTMAGVRLAKLALAWAWPS